MFLFICLVMLPIRLDGGGGGGSKTRRHLLFSLAFRGLAFGLVILKDYLLHVQILSFSFVRVPWC